VRTIRIYKLYYQKLTVCEQLTRMQTSIAFAIYNRDFRSLRRTFLRIADLSR